MKPKRVRYNVEWVHQELVGDSPLTIADLMAESVTWGQAVKLKAKLERRRPKDIVMLRPLGLPLSKGEKLLKRTFDKLQAERDFKAMAAETV